MLNVFNQNMAMDGQSVIEEEVVANMNMNVNGTGENMTGAYFNMSVTDMNKFMANKSVVMADFNDFCNKAIALIEDVQNSVNE